MKKFLALFMVLVLCMAALPAAAFAAHSCAPDAGSSCIVCKVAGMINALPEADDITAGNAAGVINQIHAIDRVKVDLTDDQYETLLTLVENGNDGSGYGMQVPVRYMEAVEAVKKLDTGADFYITKGFSANGFKVNVNNAQVQLKITNVNSGASQVLTMSTMPYQMNSLSADPSFYSEQEGGWSYRYILPAGTIKLKKSLIPAQL